jgi:hypothetical protein
MVGGSSASVGKDYANSLTGNEMEVKRSNCRVSVGADEANS